MLIASVVNNKSMQTRIEKLNKRSIRRASVALLSGAVLIAPTVLMANACDQSPLYQAKSLQQVKQDGDALTVMRTALKLCEDYESQLYVGQLYQRLGKYSAARKAYGRARGLTDDPNLQAGAVAHYGNVLLKSGRRVEALSILQSAISLYDQPPTALIEQTKALDLQLSHEGESEQMLTRGFSNQSFSALALPPSVNVRLNFVSNSTELDAESQQRLPLLAEQLSQQKYSSKSIWLVGHSDARGDADYNMKLSWARSEAIHDALIAINPGLRQQLKIDGKGEAEPLYQSADSSEFFLNRRLQIIIK